MKVYFVRHGQSESNKLQIHQDSADLLSDEGLKQGNVVAHRFKKINIDVILSSDYIRALDTAEEIAKVTNKKIEVTELLRERKRPSSLVGKRYDSEEVLHANEKMETQKHMPDFHHSDEENHTEALNRAQMLLRFLEKRQEENILVVTHAAFMRFILTCIVFGPNATVQQFEKMYDSFRMHNTGITICKYKEGLRSLYKKETYWYVDTWNDHAHLG